MKKFVVHSCPICFGWLISMTDNPWPIKKWVLFERKISHFSFYVQVTNCWSLYEKNASSGNWVERCKVRESDWWKLISPSCSREKLSSYESVWQAPNDLMNCLKCGALLPFGQHNSEHNERVADIITWVHPEQRFPFIVDLILAKMKVIKGNYNNYKWNLMKVKVKKEVH